MVDLIIITILAVVAVVCLIKFNAVFALVGEKGRQQSRYARIILVAVILLMAWMDFPVPKVLDLGRGWQIPYSAAGGHYFLRIAIAVFLMYLSVPIGKYIRRRADQFDSRIARIVTYVSFYICFTVTCWLILVPPLP